MTSDGPGPNPEGTYLCLSCGGQFEEEEVSAGDAQCPVCGENAGYEIKGVIPA